LKITGIPRAIDWCEIAPIARATAIVIMVMAFLFICVSSYQLDE
jgi:hypothetical protein